jgi:hypothetical protein
LWLQSWQYSPYGPLTISRPASRQYDAARCTAPRSARGMLPPTGAGVCGSGSPSITTRSTSGPAAGASGAGRPALIPPASVSASAAPIRCMTMSS